MVAKTMPRRYMLIIEFDGTGFSGWQIQQDARTVQGDLLKAAARVFGTIPVDIQGCGRTDAGVHALAYVAHLEVVSDLAAEAVGQMLNETLPKDIVILKVKAVDLRFHARHSCRARSYIYQIRLRKSAFGKRYSWWIREELDLGLMQQVGAVMVGMHDYAAFAEKQELKKSTRVLVHSVRCHLEGDILTLRVVGSHFLWHMVRKMAALLVEIGSHRLRLEQVESMLSNPGERVFNQTAPAAGLFFERAFYDIDELEGYPPD
jgi:tRNA pseudouridine38-40 synthase